MTFACSAKELVPYSEVSGNPLKALRQKVARLFIFEIDHSVSRVGDGR